MSEAMDHVQDIKVIGFTIIGNGIGSYVSYNIESKTNITVSRRFSDFLGLHRKLVEKYLKMGRIIPPAPEKDVFGTARVRISGSRSEQNTSSAEFLERRRAALERFLRRIASHPILGIDADFREFVESEGELPKATSTSSLSRAGFKRLLNKFSEIDTTTIKIMEESDHWFDQKISLMEKIDAQLLKMLGNIEELVKKRRELAFHTTQFAKSAEILSNLEEHDGLSRSLSPIVDVEEKIENLNTEQAILNSTILRELFKDYMAFIVAVRDTFHERVKVYQHLKNAQMMLEEKVKQTKKPLKMSKIDQYYKAHKEVSELQNEVNQREEEFQKISQVIKVEFELFEKNRTHDFKTIFEKYSEGLVQHREQIKKQWENHLPEAKAIN